MWYSENSSNPPRSFGKHWIARVFQPTTRSQRCERCRFHLFRHCRRVDASGSHRVELLTVLLAESDVRCIQTMEDKIQWFRSIARQPQPLPVQPRIYIERPLRPCHPFPCFHLLLQRQENLSWTAQPGRARTRGACVLRTQPSSFALMRIYLLGSEPDRRSKK